MRGDLPKFIRDHIKTVRSLELLLLMRSQRERVWTVEELIKELRGSRRIVDDAIAQFSRAGIVRETDEGFMFAPISQLEAVIGDCAIEYEQRPTFSINLILDSQNEKLQAFSDAFRIKRD